MFGKYDPAEFVKKRFRLTGWRAEAADWIVGFFEAALVYFIILPAILGAYPPAVVVQTCSMAGTYNVGDIAVMAGTEFDSLRAPHIATTSLQYSIVPNNISEQTQRLVFSDGQELAVETWGDIILHESPTTGEQIIHRAIAKVSTPRGNYILTKGDTNTIPDATRIECAEWVQQGEGLLCTRIREDTDTICTEADRGYPGCLSTPVPEDRVLGRSILTIPLLGHVKMAFMHVVTLGHGYPGPLWC